MKEPIPIPPPDNDNIEDFSVTVRGIPKEATARVIAASLLKTFSYAVWGILFGGFILFAILAYRGVPDDGMKLVKEGILPFIAGVGTFAITVFGPLLAFVLGYYFGETKGK